ncbi:MAG: hybrid sensor histidine kinase/response regulator [Deltaproteobacteria bacterium]
MAERLRVLVVDHDPIHRLGLLRALEQSTLGAEIIEVGTPDAALDEMKAAPVDCVLLDQDLPAKGALAVIVQLRGDRNPVAILLITGLHDEDLLQQAIDCGVTDFFAKSDLSPRRLGLRVKFAIRLAAAEVDNVRSIETATAAARARDEILAIVSHDLRGPLHAISLASEALREDANDDGKRYLAAIDRAGARAERLISDLLDASAIENGKLSLTESRINLNAVVKQAATEHELTVKASGGSIKPVVPEELVYVKADRDRLLQALANLVGNALKHARGTPIEISVDRRDGHAILAVQDRGPGIKGDEMQHVFDRYWSGRTRKGGAGLGLAIAKGIALAHGGTIQAFSRPGEGARFELALPLA